MRKPLLLLFFTLCLFLPTLSAADNCSPYKFEVRRWHSKYFGINFPYWYSVAQIQVESNCRNTISTDGVGSEGLPQITYRVWEDELKKVKVYNLKTISNQLHAQAYINYYNYKKIPVKKLYIMYQAYNRSIQSVIDENKHGNYELGKLLCELYNKKLICVKKIDNKCLQYRTNCDINYTYSLKIYKTAQQYKTSTDTIQFF